MIEKVVVLERGEGMVLASHPTHVGGGLVAVTVETVTLEPPTRISFRLVRGAGAARRVEAERRAAM